MKKISEKTRTTTMEKKSENIMTGKMKRIPFSNMPLLIGTIIIFLLLASSSLALTVSEVKVIRTTSSSAQINWLTDEPSNARVRYGLTTSLGFSEVQVEQRLNHTIALSDLQSGSTYFFEVVSQTSDGDERVDDNSGNFYTFATRDITPPPKVTGIRLLSSTLTSVSFAWNPSSASDVNHYLVYEDRVLIGNVTKIPLPSFNVSITPGASKSYKISAVDTSGNEGQLSETLSLSAEKDDTSAPTISGLDFRNATDTSVMLVWVTSEDATAELRYGITTPSSIERDERLLTSHEFEITNLRNNATYVFSITSCDQSLNCASLNSTFRAGKDSRLQFLNATLPRFTSRRTLDIAGSTKPFSEVTLSVNNLNLPARFLTSHEVGSSGKILFRGIMLNKDNVIKIVSRDKSGLTKEIITDVSVDTDAPVALFKDLPSITSKKNLTVSGSVNEPVTIRAFVRSSKEKETLPGNITGFRNGSISENAVTLIWSQSNDKDFSHYILRRSDVGAIAVIQPASYLSYTDILVDAGRTYSYTLSYMNDFGKESRESAPVTVTMPSTGIVLGIKPPLVDILQDFRKPTEELVLNTSGDFLLSFLLGRDDAPYDVKIEVIDRAGNRMGIEKEISLDTKLPEIKVLSPPNNALVFETYANSIDVEGKTEPGARVHLYVGRTPFNMDNLTFDISGLKKEIQDMPETDLDANCKAVIRTKNLCGTNADYSTTADNEGNFFFRGVDATSFFAAGGSIREIDEKDFTSSGTNIRESRKAKFVLIATDQAGLRNTIQNEITIGTCWSGNLSWDVIPLAEFQSPTLLSTERLSENTESIYFYLNYSYIGTGNQRTAKIKSVSLTKACGTKEVLDPRFNISCQILPSGAQTIQVNPEGSVSYSAIRLSRIAGMERWLSGDWKGFFSAINKELSFPFKVTINYQHEVNGRMVNEVQTTCQELTYVLDNSRIDPRDILPDWLLYDAVDLLNQSIATIHKVQEQIDAIMPYVATGCLAAYGSNFATQLYRRWNEIFTEKKFVIEKTTQKIQDAVLDTSFTSTSNGQGSSNQDYCKTLVRSFESSKEYKRFKFEYLSDSDLEKCFPSVASAWKAEETTYKAYRYACDRLFGHTTPARWTETKKDSELQNKLALSGQCANDQTAKGYPVRKVNCQEAAGRIPSRLGSTNFARDDECLLIERKEGIRLLRSLYLIDKVPLDPNTNLYRITHGMGDAYSAEDTYAIKVTEDNYLLPQQKTCDQVCGVKTKSSKKISIGGKEVFTTQVGRSQNQRGGVCTTAQSCISFNNRARAPADVVTQGDVKYEDASAPDKAFVVQSAKREGFTTDCFYGADDDLNNPSVVGNNLNQRYECCCLEGKPGEIRQYYDYRDTYLDPAIPTDTKQIHKALKLPEGTTLEKDTPAPLQWSYRYSKIKFQARDYEAESNYRNTHSEYNPYRYIDGRDFPACFGQNALLGFDTDTLMLDSNRQHTSAIQCVNIGGIQQRLTLLNNILSSMQTCLIQVRTTGRADSGVCKELFTQYVCSFTWDVIQAAQYGLGGCDKWFDFSATNEDDALADIAYYAKGGLKGITDTLSDKQSEFMGEYGNTKLNEMFGGGAEATARKICLAAFGYDWPFSVKGFMDASYAQPFATLVQAVTASRDYLTVDPKSREATYEYRSSWLINPGCDFANYKVELACVGRDTLDAGLGADCTKQRAPDGVNCPCLDAGEKTVEFFTDSRAVKQNQLVDRDFHKVVSSRYRYDHLKITLRPNQKIDKKIRDRCYPSGYGGGVFYFPLTDRTAHDIAACKIEPISGILMCDGGADFFSRKGFAYFSNLKINDHPADEVRELLTGDELRISTEVFKTGDDKCLRVSIDRPLSVNTAYPIVVNGTYPFNEVVVPRLTISTLPDIRRIEGVTIVRDTTVSTDPFTLPIYIEDMQKNQGEQGNGVLSADDKVGFTQNDFILVGREGQVTSPDGTATLSTQSNTEVLIDRSGNRLRIVSVNFNPILASGQVKRDRIIDSISVQPPTSITSPESQQTMTLRIGLYGLRQSSTEIGATSGFRSPSDCNFNDPATDPNGNKQEKIFTITIRNTGGSSSSPSVSGPFFDGGKNVYLPGEEPIASVRISKRESSSAVESATLKLAGPDGSALGTLPLKLVGSTDSFTENWEERIPSSFLSTAGTYRASVEVKYGTPSAQSSSATSQSATSSTQSIEVRCAQTGICGIASRCQSEVPADLRCQGSQICCPG